MSKSKGIQKRRQYWTEEQVQWILDNYTRHSTIESLRGEYNKVFPERDYDSIKNKIDDLKIHLRKYDACEVEWLEKHHAEYETYPALLKAFNIQFGRSKKLSALSRFCQSKGWYLGMNELPVGAVVSYGGKTWIKIKATNGNAHQCSVSYPYYENYATYKYREYYGELPKGYKVLHLNMDREDFSKENLYAISPYVQTGLMRERWFNTDRDITLAAIKKLELDETIKRMEE